MEKIKNGLLFLFKIKEIMMKKISNMFVNDKSWVNQHLKIFKNIITQK